MKNYLLIVTLFLSQTVIADTITEFDTSYYFSGVVSNVDQSGTLLNGAIQTGDVFNGVLQYNSFSPYLINLDVSVGGYSFSPNVSSVLIDDNLNGEDVIIFSSDAFSEFSNSSYASVQLKFVDSTGTLLSGTADPLPDYFLLNQFDSVLLSVNQTTFENSTLSGYSITGGVLQSSEFSPVPIPAAVWLFGSGLLGLVGVARRK